MLLASTSVQAEHAGLLTELVNWFVYDALALESGSRLSSSIHFFIYDSVKIFLLLWIMIFVIGFLRTWLPQEKIRSWMGQRGILANTFASLFGALTPFCSCSSIPLFVSFLSAGVPLGVTFSFLITSPIINEYLVILMLGAFGWKITALYVLSGLFIGITSGYVLGKLGLEKHLESDLISSTQASENKEIRNTIQSRLAFGLNEANDVVKKIWMWVFVGIALGAIIHNYVPQESIENAMNTTGYFSVPIATLLGVPMYGSCAAIVPIAVVLFEKGIPLGTALAFMMAMAALSLPEAIMLRRAMKLNLIAIFFGVTTLAIIFTGYLFNLIQNHL